MKICTKCQIEKPLTEFYSHKRTLDGFRHDCKQCGRLTGQTTGKAAKKRYRDAKKLDLVYVAKRRQQDNLRRANDPEHKLKAKTNNDRLRTTITFRANELWRHAKKRAMVAKEPFDVSLHWIEVMIRMGICERSGLTFDLSTDHKTRRNPFAPSIDRIDSFKPYIMTNVQIVCNMYNTGKGQHTDEEFLRLCAAVVETAKRRGTI